MFLNTLHSSEKELFLKLAIAVVKADGIVEESERQVISAYANEMQITLNDINKPVDTEQIIKELAISSSANSQKVVFLELLALAFADGNYSIEEKTLILQIANAFGLDEEFITKSINLIDAYVSIYMSFINLIEKGE